MTDLDDVVQGGVVAVLRDVPADRVLDVASALHDGGVTAIEVTMNSAGAADSIAHLADWAGDDVAIGAGTVLDAETARTAHLAGASFVVTPTFDRETVATCNRYGVPVAPGVATPTEALTAYEAGADCVKLFPASSLGPDYVSALGGPLDQIPVIPTGGVSLDNAAAFFEAGAIAVGVGSSLVPDEAVDGEQYDELTRRAADFVEIASQHR